MPDHKVHIRIATSQDAHDYKRYLDGIREERLLTLIPPRHSTPRPISKYEKFILKHDGNGESVLFLATENSELIGTIHLTQIERQELGHAVFLGLNVKKTFRGKGIGTVLLLHGMDWAKEKPAIERIELEVLANNQHAISMYEKVGFVKEGVKKSAVKKGSEYIDIIIMGIILRK
jgi:RimJ/RimL family protein N-acetyltransferase